MKTIVAWTTALVAVTALCFAAVPQTINYQGYLKNTDGTPVSIATNIRFSLYSSNPARNNPIWTETKSVAPANGIYSTQLGSVTPITAPFDVPYYLGVKVEGDYEMALQTLSGVPYALRAGCNPGDMLNCYTGPIETLNTGICKAGMRTCLPDGSRFGSCVGEFTPNCNGACLDFSNNVVNCGSCGTVCAAYANAIATCTVGMCGFVCNSGYGNCDAIAANGCEISLLTSTSNCGACRNVCPTRANATTTCSSGTCGFVCNSGYANCDGNATNGCEINILTSTSSCGTCGNVCPTRANATTTCSSGTCGFVCTTGWGNCDGDPVNGCEISLLTSTSNCGACRNICPARANATTTCSAGVCGFVCNSGYANCDGIAANGCEINTLTSNSNCGRCGSVCSGGSTCVSGVCTP